MRTLTVTNSRGTGLIAGGRVPFSISSETVLRAALFAGIFIYFWVGFEVFQDYTDPRVLLLNEEGSALRQIGTLGLFGMAALFAYHRCRDELPVLVTPFLVLLMCWLLVTVVGSTLPMLSAKRFVLATMIMSMAAVVPLLAESERQFQTFMASCLVAVIGLSFAAVLVAPNLSIHQPWDLKESNLAGAWRGAFQHKNAAGSAMAVAIFLGLYIARARNLMLGGAIVVSAAIFLYFSMSKTPPMFILPTLALSWVILKLKSTFARAALLIAVIALVNLFTLGTVVFPAIQSIVEKSLSDPTFTNRAEIWQFAIQELKHRTATGYGFHAFWGTSAVFNSGSSAETWATKAGHAHNGYLDAALNTGYPALIFITLWLVFDPLRDLATAERRNSNRVLNTLYVHLLVFGLLVSSLESQFFAVDGPIWFMILLAVFGLRFQATSNLISASTPDRPEGKP